MSCTSTRVKWGGRLRQRNKPQQASKRFGLNSPAPNANWGRQFEWKLAYREPLARTGTSRPHPSRQNWRHRQTKPQGSLRRKLRLRQRFSGTPIPPRVYAPRTRSSNMVTLCSGCWRGSRPIHSRARSFLLIAQVADLRRLRQAISQKYSLLDLSCFTVSNSTENSVAEQRERTGRSPGGAGRAAPRIHPTNAWACGALERKCVR